MLFGSASALSSLALLGSALAATTHRVNVGNGSLTFSPNTTYAAVGDTIVFHFFPRMHNVVQGPFNTPCMSTSGIYSGYIPSSAGEANHTFHVKINDTNPIWLYCSQQGGGGHCGQGMVGVVNPPNGTNHTLAAYKLGASKIANTSYTQPSMIQGGVVVLRNTTSSTTSTRSSTSTAQSSTGTVAATTTGGGAAGAGATTSSSSAAPTRTNGAESLAGAAKWGIGAAAGGLAVLLI